MTRDEALCWIDEIKSEVESIKGDDPEIRLRLLDLSHNIICRVKDLRSNSIFDGVGYEK